MPLEHHDGSVHEQESREHVSNNGGVPSNITYLRGSVLDAIGDVQVLVNTVNTKGVMGKGLAKEFRDTFPKMYEDYRERCQGGHVRVGEPYLYKVPKEDWVAKGDKVPKEEELWILNFPTKDDWRRPSRLEWIKMGLEYFVAHYQSWGIKSIAFPQLGVRNGKLPWDKVKPLMERYLGQIDIPVLIYIYDEDQDAQRRESLQQPKKRGSESPPKRRRDSKSKSKNSLASKKPGSKSPPKRDKQNPRVQQAPLGLETDHRDASPASAMPSASDTQVSSPSQGRTAQRTRGESSPSNTHGHQTRLWGEAPPHQSSQ